MALLNKRVKGATLAESVMAMTLSLFLFSFTAWFFVQINQNKTRINDRISYQILLARSDKDVVKHAKLLTNMQTHSKKSDLNGDDRLEVEEVFILDRYGKTVYAIHFWNLKPQINEIE